MTTSLLFAAAIFCLIMGSTSLLYLAERLLRGRK